MPFTLNFSSLTCPPPLRAKYLNLPFMNWLIQWFFVSLTYEQCDPAYTANMFMDLLAEKPDALMTFGAACSDVTEILAEMSAYRKLVQVYFKSYDFTCGVIVLSPSVGR